MPPAGWDGLGEAVDALAFPRICPICDADAEYSAFCPPCRAELLEAAGSTCPRCAMPVGPHALLARGLLGVPGPVARVRRRGRPGPVSRADPDASASA